MESTAINTVYILMHAKVEDQETLEFWNQIGKGCVFSVFSDKREASKAMQQANENVEDIYERFFIIERILW